MMTSLEINQPAKQTGFSTMNHIHVINQERDVHNVPPPKAAEHINESTGCLGHKISGKSK
ncbi:hypothetical protein NECAME_03753 [Necator americanus]|uniref:Uncharacterized protein n=1 Tax=Necator americanus TaxID=51031 RepID=W2T0Y8_NECAM|nr:hypothetical protein NECAME_03753 [Necator americanus]ETN75563.1 hypothetical protein NECAME_03753 [Necator americanus]